MRHAWGGRDTFRRESNVILLLSAVIAIVAFVLQPDVREATGVFAVAVLIIFVALFVRLIY